MIILCLCRGGLVINWMNGALRILPLLKWRTVEVKWNGQTKEFRSFYDTVEWRFSSSIFFPFRFFHHDAILKRRNSHIIPLNWVVWLRQLVIHLSSFQVDFNSHRIVELMRRSLVLINHIIAHRHSFCLSIPIIMHPWELTRISWMRNYLLPHEELLITGDNSNR